MKTTNLRRKLYVSRAIQGRLLWRMVGHWLFYNLLVWHALLVVDFHRYAVTGLFDGGPRMSLLEFYADFASRNVVLLVMALVVAPITLWDMLKLTHQIAGPLVRFQNTLRKMTAGKPVTKVALREGDLLLEFEEVFNAFLASDRLIVGERTGAHDTSAIAAKEAAVLAAVAELQKELRATGSDQTPAAKATATVR